MNEDSYKDPTSWYIKYPKGITPFIWRAEDGTLTRRSHVFGNINYTLDQYQKQCLKTAVYPESSSGSKVAITYCSLKLAGEAGEIAEKVGKYFYRGDRLPLNVGETHEDAVRSMLKKEIGDVLWYCAQLSAELGFSLSEVAGANIEKLSGRAERGTLKGSGDDR